MSGAQQISTGPSAHQAAFAPHRNYFDARRAAVEPFVRRHFSLKGTLRLHREAVGWDLLRAPANVALAPVHIASHLLAWTLGRVGLRRASNWLFSQRLLFRTAVEKRVEALILDELLASPAGVPAADGGPEAPASHASHIRQVGNYGGARSAVNEMTVAVGALSVGASAFHAVTPGVLSLAPMVALTIANSAAIAAFPLGVAMGSFWYGLFPAEAPLWLMASVGFGLAASASIVATFAGIVADPAQLHLGIHRRRLLRLIDALEAEHSARGSRAFAPREQYFARLSDLSDVGVALTSLFR